MSWNNAPPPPFPPPGYQHPPPPPPPFPAPPGVAQGGGNAGNGVDHTCPDHGFEFGPGSFNAWSGPFGFSGAWGPRGHGGWGFGLGPRGGRRGRGGHHGHGHRHHRETDNDEDLYDITAAAAAAEADVEAIRAAQGDAEKADSPATAGRTDGEHPDPPEEAPPSSPHRHHGCRGRSRGFGFGSRRGGGGFRWHPPFVPPAGAPFMPEGLQEAVRQASDAMARFNQQWGRAAAPEEDTNEDSNTFTPPVDLFDTRDNWTIHVALPGARKEDLGVNWDPARSVLTISGVVHRLGDEEFLAGLVSSERRIGMFERKIMLPPAVEGVTESGTRDEVDGDNIQARMQDGILVVVVPKVEKDWTEVKKIDIL